MMPGKGLIKEDGGKAGSRSEWNQILCFFFLFLGGGIKAMGKSNQTLGEIGG